MHMIRSVFLLLLLLGSQVSTTIAQGDGDPVVCGPTEGLFELTYAKDYEFSRADWILLNITTESNNNNDVGGGDDDEKATSPPLLARCFGFPDRTCTLPLSSTPSEYETYVYTRCLPRDNDCYRLVTFGNYYGFPEESTDYIQATFDGTVVVANRSNDAFDTFHFGGGCPTITVMETGSDCATDESLLELFFWYEAPAEMYDESTFRYVDDFTPLPEIRFTVTDAAEPDGRRWLDQVVQGDNNETMALQYMRQCVPQDHCWLVQAQAPAFSDRNPFYKAPYQVKLDGVVFGDQEFDPFTECNRETLTESILVAPSATTCTAAQVCPIDHALMHLAVAPIVGGGLEANPRFRWDYSPRNYVGDIDLVYCWNGENRLYPRLSPSTTSFAAIRCVPAGRDETYDVDQCLKFAIRTEEKVLDTITPILTVDGRVLTSQAHFVEGVDRVIYYYNCDSTSAATSRVGVPVVVSVVAALFYAAAGAFY